jgi:hypothetical protein
MTSQKGVNADVWRLMDSLKHHDLREAVALTAEGPVVLTQYQ